MQPNLPRFITAFLLLSYIIQAQNYTDEEFERFTREINKDSLLKQKEVVPEPIYRDDQGHDLWLVDEDFDDDGEPYYLDDHGRDLWYVP